MSYLRIYFLEKKVLLNVSEFVTFSCILLICQWQGSRSTKQESDQSEDEQSLHSSLILLTCNCSQLMDNESVCRALLGPAGGIFLY